MKKSNKAKNLIEVKCSVCGKKTKHYLSKDGDYKCLLCGTVNKSTKVKEIVFEPDKDFLEEKKLKDSIEDEE